MSLTGPLARFGLDLIVAAVLALAALFFLAVLVAVAAEPGTSPGTLLEAGDPRSAGEGPGLVGSPLVILAGVVALGSLTALVTVLLVRLVGRDRA